MRRRGETAGVYALSLRRSIAAATRDGTSNGAGRTGAVVACAAAGDTGAGAGETQARTSKSGGPVPAALGKLRIVKGAQLTTVRAFEMIQYGTPKLYLFITGERNDTYYWIMVSKQKMSIVTLVSRTVRFGTHTHSGSLWCHVTQVDTTAWWYLPCRTNVDDPVAHSNTCPPPPPHPRPPPPKSATQCVGGGASTTTSLSLLLLR